MRKLLVKQAAVTGIARTDTAFQFHDITASEIVRAASEDRWEGWLYINGGIIAMFGAALLWAANCNIEEVTTGSAQIVPSSREQVLQSPEGGILQQLLVHEGDTVEKGRWSRASTRPAPRRRSVKALTGCWR